MNIPAHALEGKTQWYLCFSPETSQDKFPVLGVRDPESEGSTLLYSYSLPLAFFCSQRWAAGPAMSPWPKRHSQGPWIPFFLPTAHSLDQ